MKKIILFLILLLIITGCSSKKEKIVPEGPIKEEPIDTPVEEYKDDNDTKIGLYLEKGGRIELITEYKTTIQNEVDAGVFQIYPSNDNEIILDSDFGTSFYNKWTSLPNYKDLKIGFNLKYTLSSGEEVSYNILDYKIVYKEFYDYLYDDYANRYNSWYSHIEESDYTEDTLYTSIKLYSADVNNINSKVYLTVFTYDSQDDFDENNEYRGNSSYTITICDINKTC